MIAARQYSSVDEMMANYARIALYTRPQSPPKRVVTLALVKPEEPPAPRPMVPLWAVEDVWFRAHVDDWLNYRLSPVKSYLKARCKELQTRYADVIGPERWRELVKVRHQLMFEVHEKFNLSYPEIGRQFGGRDHTSALHAVQKVKRNGSAICAKPSDHLELVKSMFFAGDKLSEIAKATGAADGTIRHFIKKQGWTRP
jgi:hypothetical protein